MVRQRRELSSSGVYHVMIRGNEKKNIFLDDEDKERFLDLLNEKKVNDEYKIYAYCLMDNHVHLLLKEEKDNISRIMKRINISYAYYFNKKYEKIGHVFQDRFKSEPIENETYLLAAIRYIHNNPVKANIAENPLEYRWSSYISYISKEDKRDRIINIDFILVLFSEDKEKAIELFKEYSNQENEDVFIDEIPKKESKKTILSEKAAKDFINNFLNQSGITMGKLKDKGSKKARNELILALRQKSNLSIRKIADLLEVNRGTIQRIRQ